MAPTPERVRHLTTRVATAARERGVGPTAVALSGWAVRVVSGLPSTVVGPRRSFTYRGRSYPYAHHRYLRTWMTERAVELPICWELVQSFAETRLLEVGRTLPQYFECRHAVLDKYDAHPDVIREDVVDFRPDDQLDLIVSISTLEHVGWDEAPRDPEKALHAIAHLRGLLAPGGTLLFTWPVGYNPALDAFASEGRFPVEGGLRRVGRTNEWREASWEELADAQYDFLLFTANAVAVSRLGPCRSSG